MIIFLGNYDNFASLQRSPQLHRNTMIFHIILMQLCAGGGKGLRTMAKLLGEENIYKDAGWSEDEESAAWWEEACERYAMVFENLQQTIQFDPDRMLHYHLLDLSLIHI